MYDRFLIRKEVLPVSDREIGNLLQLKKQRNYSSIPLTDELILHIKELSYNVTIPQEVLDLIRDIRVFLRDELEPPIYVSDRRLVKAMDLLKVSAVTNGRAHVSLVDTLLLSNILWYSPDERKVIKKFLWNKIIRDDETKSFRYIFESLKSSIIKTLEDSSTIPLVNQISELESLSKILAKKIIMTKMILKDFNQHFWISTTDLIQLRQQLGPKANSNIEELEKLMIHCNSLIIAIGSDEIDKLNFLKSTIDSSSSSLTGKYSLDDDNDDNDDNNNDDDDDSVILSSIELAYTKKEAMKLLTKDKYNVWKKRKNQRVKKRNSIDDY